MVKDNSDIEKLFKQEFEHFEVQPSKRVWKGVRSELFRKQFMQFNPNTFNVYYLSALLIAGTVTFLLFTVPHTREKESNVQNYPVVETPVPPLDNNVRPSASVEKNLIRENSVKTKIEKKVDVKNQSNSVTNQIQVSNVNNNPISKSSAGNEQKPDSQNLKYTPNQVPLSYFNVSSREGCVPLTVYFTNYSENGVNYSWNFGDGGSSSEKNPAYIFDVQGTYFVNLTVVTKEGDISASTDSIHVYPLPYIRFSLDSGIVPGSGQPVYFYNYSKGADYFEWNFGDGNKSVEKEPSHYFEKPGNYNISLTAISSFGCRDSLVLKNALAVKLPDIIFPTAFTPNRNGPSDGYYSAKTPGNDVFHPFVGEGTEEYQLRIFNRIGILVFESNDINIGWDGYYHQELLPQGVYIWKVRGRFSSGRSFVKMGDVTLLWTQER
jgi:gliding motility-associated-like protein